MPEEDGEIAHCRVVQNGGGKRKRPKNSVSHIRMLRNIVTEIITIFSRTAVGSERASRNPRSSTEIEKRARETWKFTGGMYPYYFVCDEMSSSESG